MAFYLAANYPEGNIDDYEGLFGPSLMFQYGAENHDSGIALRDNSARTKLAAEFVAIQANDLVAVDVRLQRVGSLSGVIFAEIYSNSGGLPGSLLGTSDSLNVVDILSTEYETVRFEFPTPVALSASDTYYVVLAGTFAISGTNFIRVSRDTTPSVSYRAHIYNGATWSEGTYMLITTVYVAKHGEVAQSFRASGVQRVDHVTLYLKKSGTLTGNLFVEIVGSDSGYPDSSGPDNNLSDGVAASVLTTTVTAIDFVFDTPPELVDGNRYYIILRSTGTLTDANNVLVGVDSSGPTYSGQALYRSNNDGTWFRDDDVDAAFAVYSVEEALPSTLSDELMTLGDPPADCRGQQTWLISLVAILRSFYPSVLPEIYGGTGKSQYTQGDILVASDTTHLELLGAGNLGSVLTQGSETPYWNDNINGVQTFLNESGGQLNPYDAVVQHNTIAQAVKVDSSSFDGNPDFVGIVQDILPDQTEGPIMTHGVTLVRVNGTVALGDPLYIDSSTRRLRTADPPLFPAAAYALEAGSSGDLIQVLVNSNKVFPKAAETLLISSNVSFPGAYNTWDNRPASTRITARVYTGSVLVGFQGVVQNPSAAAGFAQVGLYVDGALYEGVPLVKTSQLNNNEGSALRFTIVVTGLTPGSHTFDLGVWHSAGSFTLLSGLQTGGAAEEIPRALIWVKE